MFVQVIVNPALVVGNVVSYSSTTSKWEAASNSAGLIGVIMTTPDSEGLASVQFAGISYALASRDIPDEGGNLAVENGQVFVSSDMGAGVVSPKDKNATTRLAGELVMIHVR